MLKPEKKSIKFWSIDDRPREKFSSQGAKALSNSELLALVIGNGYKDFSALDLAKNILLNANNSLEILAGFSVTDFQKQHGIGHAKAVTLAAVFEIARRRAAEAPLKQIKITGSQEAYKAVLPKVEGLKHEEFGVLILNRAHKIISTHMVSKGGVSATVVDPKIIFHHALAHLASSIVLFHNHPSGRTVPSEQDNRLTERVKQGAKLLDIALIDHIIVGANAYYSYADNGKL